MIVFRNPGEIDIRAVTLFGVNVKNSDNPIGYFGTGLKYALAVILRKKQKIEIWSGLKRYTFFLKPIEFRNKEFQGVFMSDDKTETQLAFTTEQGKNWTLADAYRELWSNCQDENGKVTEERSADAWTGVSKLGEGDSVAAPDTTSINVIGEEFAKVHDGRFGPILLPENLVSIYTDDDIEIFNGASNYVYLRGIKVLELKKPTVFTVNLKSKYVGLTEDRTLAAGDYWLNHYMKDFLLNKAAPETVESLVCCGEQYHEAASINLVSETKASNNFIQGVAMAIKRRPTMANESAVNLLFKIRRGRDEAIKYDEVALTDMEQSILAECLLDLKAWGFDYENLNARLLVTEVIGEGCLGLCIAPMRLILIARKTIHRREILLGTLIEEYIHLKFSVPDCSRMMQERLIEELVFMGLRLKDALPVTEIPMNATPIPTNPDNDEIPF